MKDRSRSVYDFALLVVVVFAVAFASVTVYSQNQTPSQTPAPGPAAAQSPRTTPSPTPSPTPTPVNWSTDPTLKRFVFRSIGPASMGGRIDDFAVPEQNPFVFYVVFAPIGVWKLLTKGRTFTPTFAPYVRLSVTALPIVPSILHIFRVGPGH